MNEVDELRATFEAAEAFGLDAEAIWATVQGVISETPPEMPVAERYRQVVEALAQRIEQLPGEGV